MNELGQLFSLFTDHEDLCNIILSYLDIPSIYSLELSNRFFHEQLLQVNTDRCVYGHKVYKIASLICDGFLIEEEYINRFSWGSGVKCIKFRKVLEEFYNNTFSRAGFKSDTLLRVNRKLEQSDRDLKYFEIVRWMPCLLLDNMFRSAYDDLNERFKYAIFRYLIDYSKENWKTSHRDLKRVYIRKYDNAGFYVKSSNSTIVSSISDGHFLLSYLDNFKSLKDKYGTGLIYERSSQLEVSEEDKITMASELLSLLMPLSYGWGGTSICKTTIIGRVSKKVETLNLEQDISELNLELFGLEIPLVFESKNGRIAYDRKKHLFVVFPFTCARLSSTDKHAMH